MPIAIRIVGYGLAFIACGVGIAMGLGYHVPATLVVAVFIVSPVLVLALLISVPELFESGKGSKRTVNGAFVVLLYGLFSATSFHQQLNFLLPLIPAALCGVVVITLGWGVLGRPQVSSPRVMLAAIGIIGFCYGYGASALADVEFDTSKGVAIPFTVVGKHEHRTTGRHSHTYDYLELEPSGSNAAPTSVEVSSELYIKARTGSAVCETTRPGALAMAWSDVEFCSGEADNSAL
jgi:hypothetical protein